MKDVEEIKNDLTMNLPSSSDQTTTTTTTEKMLIMSSPEVRGRALNFTNDINNASVASTEKPVNFVTNAPEIMTIFSPGGRAMVDLSDVSMDAEDDLNKTDVSIKEVTTTPTASTTSATTSTTTTTISTATLPECVMNGKIYKVRI